MKSLLKSLVSFVILGIFITRTSGSIIFESAELVGQPGGGLSLGNQFAGVRFELTSNFQTTAIGGHMKGNGTAFGTIVRLDDFADFPDSPDLSSSDVLGSTLIALDDGGSIDVEGDISLVLTPGIYALVFGSNILGASGPTESPGSFPGKDINIGTPSYFMRFTDGSYGPLPWWHSDFQQRFFLKGNAIPDPIPPIDPAPIPEPSTIIIWSILVGFGFVAKRFFQLS